MIHELRWSENHKRLFWYCTCSRFCGGPGPGWVFYIRQRDTIETSKAEAQRLHGRHIEDDSEPPEGWE